MAKNENSGVVVACKLPHGLHLDVPGQERITLLGGNADNAVGGYGLTENVDKPVLEAWIKQNPQHPILRKDANLMFIASSVNDARAQADEQQEVKTGFEGIDPKKPGNGVEMADNQKLPG